MMQSESERINELIQKYAKQYHAYMSVETETVPDAEGTIATLEQMLREARKSQLERDNAFLMDDNYGALLIWNDYYGQELDNLAKQSKEHV